jgi:hypothetical protein
MWVGCCQLTVFRESYQDIPLQWLGFGIPALSGSTMALRVAMMDAAGCVAMFSAGL